MRVAFNVGISLVISAIISWIQDLANENQRMAEISKQAADEIKGELDALEDYSDKIIRLRKELEDNNTTTERATDIRKELYDIQNDLIENYGAEKNDIDLVTGSLEKQIETIRNLGKAKYENQYYSKYQATKSTLDSLNNTSLTLDDRAWRDERNQMWQSIGETSYRDDVQNYMKSVLESAGFKYKGGFYVLDGNAFDVHEALTSVEKQINDAINNLDVNDYPNAASMAQAEKNLNHILEYLSAVNNDLTSPLIAHEEELAQYIKYESKYTKQYWKLVQDRTSYEVALESGSQEEILKARQKFIEDYNNLEIADEDNATRWWFTKEFGEVTKESEKAANTTVKNLNPIKDKLNELNSAVSELKETTDSAFSNQSTLQSAFDKIQEGSSLSADEVRKLVEICENDFPEINAMFTQTADGWTISAGNLIKANKAIIDSTKKSVQAQIDGYQEVIDAYENRKLATHTVDWETGGIPSTDIGLYYEDIGITAEEYENAKNKAEEWKLVLQMLGLTLEDNTKDLDKFNDTLKEYSSNLSTGVSAQKEMNESGKISASTLESLLSLGDDYIKCITVENGIIKFNADIFKEVTKAKLDDEIATLKLAQAEAIHARIEDAQYNKGKEGAKLQAIIDETNLKLKAAQTLRDGLDETWDNELKDNSGSSSDLTKEAFEKDMKDIEHLHNMGLKSNKEYYDALEAANEKHYKNSAEHESDYLSNIEKIYNARQSLYKDNADKQFDDLEDQRKHGIITAEQYAQALHDLGQELYGEDSVYGDTEFAIKALEELDKKVKETSEDIYDEFQEELLADGDKTLFNVLSDAEELWNRANELFAGDLTSIKSNAKDIFGNVSSALEDALKKGIITVDGYESLLRSWANTLQVTEADITEALVDTYEYRADALQKANDGSLASERKYIADMKSLNFSTYGDENSDFYDPTTYASNLRDITDYQLDVLEKALNNGEISVQEYANSVVEIFKDADVLGADYVSEKLDDIDKVRAEREKTYWEQQKELMEDYYDKQIKEIEETQKAKEKENKLEELHLKLIKARQTLEEAKNNRNQLVFHDGTFEYMADQDAVMSAEEEVANTLKEIEDEKLQAQIDLLEEQKDAALGFYDQILDEIDFYLNKTLPLSESDQEELTKIRNSDYAQYARDKRDGNLTANSDNEKIAQNALNQADIAEETKQSVSDIAKNVLDIAKVVANGFNFENLVRALGGNPTAEAVKNFQDSYNATLVGKQIEPSTLPSNITNNSSTTNNSAKTIINIEKIFENLYMPEGTTKEQVEAFFKHLNSAILQRIPQALIEVSK